MPTYEYQCNACQHRFDEYQSFSEEPLKKCPECRKAKLRRLLGAGAAIIFKGSGFYQTDYRSESYKSGAKADEPKADAPKTEGAAKDDTTASTPPAPASEPKAGNGGKGSGKKPKSST